MSRQFIDQMQYSVDVSDKPVRIISLVPSLTELLFDLGLEDRIVGVTRYCVHPGRARKEKKIVGGPKTLDFAAIDALQPDLILGNKEENYREGIERLQQQYPTWVCDIHNLDDALAMITSLGQLTNKEHNADKIVNDIRCKMARLASGKTLRVAYFIWRKPYRVAAGNTFINEMLKLCGMENVFADLERYPEITIEQLKTAGPDLLLLSSEPFPFKDRHCQEFAELGVTASTRLVDGEMFCWTGSHLRLAADYFMALNEEISARSRE
ncbi:helical backbone metal receptor [Endozoicomonas sp. ALB091]|uniref:helical backbone metal receptor n=1 Tax=Endozoicomonas sp. ALB091 TaxID=3403073 RepID=UPI003BB60A8F